MRNGLIVLVLLESSFWGPVFLRIENINDLYGSVKWVLWLKEWKQGESQ
jgi:hypothetical protein